MLNPWQEFISNGSVNNSLCFLGPHRIYSAWSSTFFELSPGQGHFGPDAIPGDVCALPPCPPFLSHPVCSPRILPTLALSPLSPLSQARWRRGESVSLEAARNSMVSLEAAAHSQMAFQKRN